MKKTSKLFHSFEVFCYICIEQNKQIMKFIVITSKAPRPLIEEVKIHQIEANSADDAAVLALRDHGWSKDIPGKALLDELDDVYKVVEVIETKPKRR